MGMDFCTVWGPQFTRGPPEWRRGVGCMSSRFAAMFAVHVCHLLDWHETVLLDQVYCKHVTTPWSICSPTFFGVSWTGGCIFDVTSSGWVSSIYQRLCWQLIVLCTLGCIESFYWSIGQPSRVSRANLGGWYEYTIVILDVVGHDHSQTCLQEASSRLRDSYTYVYEVQGQEVICS